MLVWECVSESGTTPFGGMQIAAIVRFVLLSQMRPPLPAAPPTGSVFDAAQWHFLTTELISGGSADGTAPGGCCRSA